MSRDFEGYQFGNTRRSERSAIALEQDQSDLVTLLHEFKDIFAWSDQNMSGLDIEIVTNSYFILFGN